MHDDDKIVLVDVVVVVNDEERVIEQFPQDVLETLSLLRIPWSFPVIVFFGSSSAMLAFMWQSRIFRHPNLIDGCRLVITGVKGIPLIFNLVLETKTIPKGSFLPARKGR